MSGWRRHPSVLVVVSINVAWTLSASLAPAGPWGPIGWAAEGGPVEILEVAVAGICAAAWVWIAARRWRPHRRGAILAALMVVQLGVLIFEEIDFHGFLHPYRNLRDVIRLVFPDVLDSPIVSAYLLLFLLTPLLPVARVRAFWSGAAPVRAEPDDARATLLAPLCSVAVWPLVGDAELGELHQVGVYAVLAMVTARVAWRTA